MMAPKGAPEVGCAEVLLAWGVLLPLHIAFSSFVGWKLWHWFAVTALGLPVLSFGQAMIGAALISWMQRMPPTPETKSGDLVMRTFVVLVWHATLLAVGAVGHRLGGAP